MEDSELVLDKIIDTVVQAMWETEPDAPSFHHTFGDYISHPSGRVDFLSDPANFNLKALSYIDASTRALDQIVQTLHRVVDLSAQRLKLQFFEDLVCRGAITPSLFLLTSQATSPLEQPPVSSSTPIKPSAPSKRQESYSELPKYLQVFEEECDSTDSSIYQQAHQHTIYTDSFSSSDSQGSDERDSERTMVDSYSSSSSFDPKMNIDSINETLQQLLTSPPQHSLSTSSTASTTWVSRHLKKQPKTYASCDNLRNTSYFHPRPLPSAMGSRRLSLYRDPAAPGYLAPTISSRMSSRDSLVAGDDTQEREKDRQRRVSSSMSVRSVQQQHPMPARTLHAHAQRSFVFSDAGQKELGEGRTLRARPSSTILRNQY